MCARGGSRTVAPSATIGCAARHVDEDRAGVDTGRELAEVRDQVAAEASVHLDHDRSFGAEPDLGVRDAVRRADRLVGGLQQLAQLGIGQQRVRAVDDVADLLEVRRGAELLVGNEERLVLARYDRSVDADLRTVDELFDQRPALVLGRTAAAGTVRSFERFNDSGRVVHHRDADARGHPARLDHDRVADRRGGGRGLVGRCGDRELRLRQTGVGERLPGPRLVTTTLRALRGQARQFEPVRDQRGRDHRRFVVGEDAANPMNTSDRVGDRKQTIDVERESRALERKDDGAAGDVRLLPAGRFVVDQPQRPAGRRAAHQVLAVRLEATAQLQHDTFGVVGHAVLPGAVTDERERLTRGW
jgi:hypothetical protein